jgi:hypothetical protein
MEPKESGRKLKGCLLPPGDLSAPRPLRPGDPVMAQYQGNPRHAWYAGTATVHNADGSWLIEYDGSLKFECGSKLRALPGGLGELPCIEALVLVKPHESLVHRRPRRRLGGEGLEAAAGTAVCDIKAKLMQRRGTCLPSAARSRPGPCPCSTLSTFIMVICSAGRSTMMQRRICA